MFQLLFFIFLDLSSISTVQADTLIVSKIDKIDLNEAAPYQMRIHYTIETEKEFSNVEPAYPKWHLNIWQTPGGGGEPQQQSVYATKVQDKYCEFDVDLDVGGVDIEFVLAGQDEHDVDQVTTDIKLTLLTFPSDLDTVAMWVGQNDDIALRVTTGITDAFTYDDKGCIGVASTTCYYVDVTKDKKNAIELCYKVTPTRVQTSVAVQEDISVCDITQIVADAGSDMIGNGAAPDTAEISYGKTGQADITISRSTDDFEIIVYTKTGEDIDESSVKVCLAATCKVGHSNHTATYTIMMVGKATGVIDPKDSTLHTLNDYDVVGSPLSNSLVETRWTRQIDEDNYLVKIDGNGEDSDFPQTAVTCGDLDNGENYHCFAYFTGLTSDKPYKLSVQITGTETNTVTLTGTKTDKDPEGMELKLSSLDTKWHKGLRRFEVNTCIHQTDTSDLSTYEAILINTRGQWKKVNRGTHRTGNEFCFDALHVDIYNFDLSEDITLVVVKRGFDGITVLETAQTDISVGGNEIAAELRNSSSGTM